MTSAVLLMLTQPIHLYKDFTFMSASCGRWLWVLLYSLNTGTQKVVTSTYVQCCIGWSASWLCQPTIAVTSSNFLILTFGSCQILLSSGAYIFKGSDIYVLEIVLLNKSYISGTKFDGSVCWTSLGINWNLVFHQLWFWILSFLQYFLELPPPGIYHWKNRIPLLSPFLSFVVWFFSK